MTDWKIATRVDIKDFFRGNLLSNVIKGFPYPAKKCPFCKGELQVVEAIHIKGQEEVFKALFICFNEKCGAYNEEASKAYVKVYYSCPEAWDKLESQRIVVENIPHQ